MDMKELRERARAKFNKYCRVCPVCNGVACAGEVPGMGGAGTGAAFKANVEALEAVKLNLRTIHGAKNPDVTLELFGVQLETPVLGAPMTGSAFNMGGALTELEFVQSIVSGCRMAGSLGMTGDTADPAMFAAGLEAIAKEQGRGITFIKPRSQDEIIKRIREVERTGAVAVGVDVDGAGLVTMAIKGQPVGPKTKEELKEIVESTELPFIIKGIMTVDEAVTAAEIGAAAIVVSNHGGRVLDHTPGTADVLSEIADEVRGELIVLVDGGIRSGADVLKLLALGADAVLVGRPLAIGAYGAGSEGVKLVVDTMTRELTAAMILTGCGTLADIDDSILYY